MAQVGRTFSVRSERVRPAPQPPSRSLVQLPPPQGVPLAPGGRFTLLTYNLLADLYATVRLPVSPAILIYAVDAVLLPCQML